jgi:hypothetical protein
MSKRRITQTRGENRALEMIVLTGLVQMDEGKVIGRLAICTSDQNGESFFLGPKEAKTALCPLCDEEHLIEDFKTAVFNGDLDVSEGLYGIDPLLLLQGLSGFRGPGVAEAHGAALRAARVELAAFQSRKAATS